MGIIIIHNINTPIEIYSNNIAVRKEPHISVNDISIVFGVFFNVF